MLWPLFTSLVSATHSSCLLYLSKRKGFFPGADLLLFAPCSSQHFFSLPGSLAIFTFCPKLPNHVMTSSLKVIRTSEVPSYHYFSSGLGFTATQFQWFPSIVDRVPANFSKNMDSHAAAHLNWIIITKRSFKRMFFKSLAGSLAIE